MFKFIAILSFAVVASAHYIPSGYHFTSLHPIHYVKAEPKHDAWEYKEPEHKEPEHKEEEHKPANYDFKYEVHDEKTGDIKRQSETAHHGVVKGQYSLIDADGYRRVVEYTADPHHGFQAVVKREPTHFKIPEQPKKVEEPKIIIHQAPVHWW